MGDLGTVLGYTINPKRKSGNHCMSDPDFFRLIAKQISIDGKSVSITKKL